MDKTEAIESKAGDVTVMYEVLALSVSLVVGLPVTADSQYRSRTLLNSDDVRQCNTRGLAVLAFGFRQEPRLVIADGDVRADAGTHLVAAFKSCSFAIHFQLRTANLIGVNSSADNNANLRLGVMLMSFDV